MCHMESSNSWLNSHFIFIPDIRTQRFLDFKFPANVAGF